MDINHTTPANDDLIRVRVELGFSGYWLATDGCGYAVRVSDDAYAEAERTLGIDADDPCSDDVRERFVVAALECAYDEQFVRDVEETNASLNRWIEKV